MNRMTEREPPAINMINYGKTIKIEQDTKVKYSCFGCERFILYNYPNRIYFNNNEYHYICSSCYDNYYSICGNIYLNGLAKNCDCNTCKPGPPPPSPPPAPPQQNEQPTENAENHHVNYVNFSDEDDNIDDNG